MVDFQMRYAVTPRYLTAPSKRRSGLKISSAVRFLVAHDTGNPGSSADANVRYYERTRDDKSASAHIFVDDREIIECVPALTAAPEKAWHVRYGIEGDNSLYGVDANDAALGIEYCYGGRIDADAAYDKYVWVLAYCLHKFELDPWGDIVAHYFLDPGRRTDPATGLAHSRRTYDQLLRDVRADYYACRGETAPAAPPSPGMPGVGTATTRVRLNLRNGAPSLRAPLHQTVPVGTQLHYSRVVRDGEPVNGNPVWLGDDQDRYFWSGGVSWQALAPPAADQAA